MFIQLYTDVTISNLIIYVCYGYNHFYNMGQPPPEKNVLKTWNSMEHIATTSSAMPGSRGHSSRCIDAACEAT